jgi:hypothetical protein
MDLGPVYGTPGAAEDIEKRRGHQGNISGMDLLFSPRLPAGLGVGSINDCFVPDGA